MVALATLTGIEAWRLPTPQSVVAKGRLVLALPMTWERVRITGAEAIAGCLLGSAVALPSAYAIYRSRLLAAAVEPFLGATQALPAIAIAPILVLWVGYGFVAIVVLCALMVFFPILVSTVVGLRHIDRELLEAAAARWGHGVVDGLAHGATPRRAQPFWVACATASRCRSRVRSWGRWSWAEPASGRYSLK